MSWQSLLVNSSLDQWTKYLLQTSSVLRNAWCHQWTLHISTARWYKLTYPIISWFPWFLNSNLPRFYISIFSRFRFGHNRLAAHAYKLNLNSYPFCPLHDEIAVCDLITYFFTVPFPLFRLFTYLITPFFWLESAIFLISSHLHLLKN